MVLMSNPIKLRDMPALRASLIWFKREIVRNLSASAADTRNPKLRAHYGAKIAKVRAMPLLALRADYIRARASEIRGARLWELSRAVSAKGRTLVRLEVQA
jgi:hypothetical protein